MISLQATRPKSPAGKPRQVTDRELSRFAELIYARTGIRVSPRKKALLSSWLRERLRRTGTRILADYYARLKHLRPDDSEWDALLQEITDHESHLFRDEVHWDWFRNEFLAQCAAEARRAKHKRTLRIWSAGCSTGDEPITVACCIAGCLPNFRQWKIWILGTDIGIGALEQAASGVFGRRAMRLVAEDCRRRFFTKVEGVQIWRAKPVLTEMIEFRRHNLMLPLHERPFDLVLLKNVLIYFDSQSKQRVVENVCKAIRPGGLLLSGAEAVADLGRPCQRLQPWLYRKPGPCKPSIKTSRIRKAV